MKKLISFFLVGVALIVQAVLLYAASSTFMMTAVIPTMTGSTISANKIDVDTGDWTPVGSNLDFSTLTLETFTNGDQAYLSSYYFAIDVAGTGGAGMPSTLVQYTEGTAPGGATAKLGDRGNVVFYAAKYQGTTECAITSHPRKLFKNITNETISPTQVTGCGTGGWGWLRMYVGLNTGETAGFVPFNPGDPAGGYTGQLKVTSTP